MFEFLSTITTPPGWAIPTFFIIVALILVVRSTNRRFYAGLLVLAFMWLLESTGVINFSASPLTVLMWGVGYIVTGVMYSHARWFSFLRQRSDELQKLKVEWILERNRGNKQNLQIVVSNNKPKFTIPPEESVFLEPTTNTKIPKAEMDKFKHFLGLKGYIRYSSAPLIPQISNHKAMIINWIVWWPWSATWALINNPIRRLTKYVIRQPQTSYQALANKVFAEFDE